MKKKILVICPHPVNVAPGQRLKYEQYFEIWEKEGYEIEVSPFMTNRFWDIVYKPGHFFEKVLWTVYGYSMRFLDLFRVKKYDLVYVFLWGTPFGSALYERLLRILASHLIFDIDDMVFLGHSSDANRFFQPLKGRGKMIYLMKTADHVITCTPLLDQFTRTFNINTTDISSTVDTYYRYQVVNKYKNDHKVVIGWSGSHSTSKYLYLLKDVLVELAKEYDFVLRVMGDTNFNIEGVDVETIEWSEKVEMDVLRSFDIGLYPLPNEEWVFGKSGLKAIQYMGLGIPTVATAIGANFRIIENEKNGYLVNVDDNYLWKEYLAGLISDPNLRRKIGAKGRITIENKYSVEANSIKYLKAFYAVIRVEDYTKLSRKKTAEGIHKKKIAIFVNSMEGGGAEGVISIFANSLSDKYDIDLLILSKGLKQDLDPRINIGLLYNSYGRKSSIKKLMIMPWLAFLLVKYLKKEKPDVVLSFLNRPNFISGISKFFVPKQRIVLNERTFPSQAYSSNKWTDILTKSLIKKLYKRADKVIVNSQGTYSDLIKKYNVVEEKLSVLHNPILFSKITKMVTDEIPFSHRRVGFKFLMLGRIDENKNQEMVLKVFLNTVSDKAWLYVFGEGSEKAKMKKYLKENDLENKVILDSYQDNPYKWMEYCDCLILNSNFEGFPNVILEALACGKPVISSDCKTGPREILCSEKENVDYENSFYKSSFGYLYEVGNVKGLEMALKSMMGEPADRFKGNKNRAKDFDSNKIVKQLDELIFE